LSFRHHFLAALSAIGFLGQSLAQTPPVPDAGRLLETLQPPPPPPVAPHAPIVVPAAAAPGEAADAGPAFVVRQFHIEGAHAFPESELAAILSDLVGREVTLGSVRQGVERITRHYQEAGYFVARAYLPPQTIANGEVRITVLEGRLGAVNLADVPGDPDGQLKARMAATLAAQGLTPQQPITRDPLERGVLLLEDLVGAEVKASLRPGASLGSGDLNLETRGRAPVSGNLGLDNYGSRYTGAWRANGGINFAQPFLAGDSLGLRLIHGEGLDFLLAAYQAPVGYDGLKLGLNASWMRYELCCGAPPIGSKGEASTVAATASYPLVLRQNHSLSLTGSLEHKALKDDTRAGNVSDKTLDLGSFGVNATISVGNLVQRGDATLVRGRLDLSGNGAALAQDAASARSNGDYTKLRYGYSLRFNATATDILQLRITGQWAEKNLDSSEKMSLGGIDGVRAYPTGEASGDEGWLARLEWAKLLPLEALPGQLGATAFIDSGRIRLNRRPWGALAGSRQEYGLSGAGLGLTWMAPGGFTAAAVLATPIGGNPGRVNGLDSDGRRQHERFWLLLNHPL